MALSSFAPPDADIPPWNWNPAATFQTSFLAAREEQRAQQEFDMNMELEKILFPLKVQTAQMNFEKLVQDRDRTMLLNEQIREARRNASTGISSALNSNVAGNGGPNAPTVGRWSAARYVGQPAQTSTPVAKPKTKPSWSVVQPAATSTGP